VEHAIPFLLYFLASGGIVGLLVFRWKVRAERARYRASEAGHRADQAEHELREAQARRKLDRLEG
jgi:hypothetical protein